MKKAVIVIAMAVAGLNSAAWSQSSTGSQGTGTGDTGNGPVPAGQSSAQDSTVGPTPATGQSSSSSVPSAAAAPGYVAPGSTAQPRSREEIQAEATEAMHSGDVPRGDASTTRDRPHGGPVNADSPSTGVGAGQTNGPSSNSRPLDTRQ